MIKLMLILLIIAISRCRSDGNMKIYSYTDDLVWYGREALIWHGEEAFELVYSSYHHGERGSIVANKERIGRIRNLPVINEHRPDCEYLRSGRVYKIEGLCSEEWIYVIWVREFRWQFWGKHHRIYKSTNIEIENPLEFINAYIYSCKSYRVRVAACCKC